MNLPIRLLASLTQGLQKQIAVMLVGEDRFRAIYTTHHMVDCARILNSELSHPSKSLNFGSRDGIGIIYRVFRKHVTTSRKATFEI